MAKMTTKTESFVKNHSVARLATADSEGAPYVIPICYAFEGQYLYIVIDHKPKRVSYKRLKRVRNIMINSKVAVVIDDYFENWERLSYVILTGKANLIEEGYGDIRAKALLREKYAQYRDMEIGDCPVIRVHIEKAIAWGHCFTS